MVHHAGTSPAFGHWVMEVRGDTAAQSFTPPSD